MNFATAFFSIDENGYLFHGFSIITTHLLFAAAILEKLPIFDNDLLAAIYINIPYYFSIFSMLLLIINFIS
jgi:hypothetical protein